MPKAEFDDEGGLAAIWEQNPEEFGSGNATLPLLTLDGIYRAKLEFDRTWGDFDLERGVLCTLSRDPETGPATTLAKRLEVPERLMGRGERGFRRRGGAPFPTRWPALVRVSGA